MQSNMGIDTAALAQSGTNIEITVSDSPEMSIKAETTINNEETSNNVTISANILKQNENDNLSYNISIEAMVTSGDSDQSVNLSANLVLGYTGLSSMNEVNENHSLQLNANFGTGELNCDASFENKVKFVDEVQVSGFADGEALNLSNYPDEQVVPFVGQVKDRVEQVNGQLLLQSGIQEEISNLGLMMFGLLANNTEDEQNSSEESEITSSPSPETSIDEDNTETTSTNEDEEENQNNTINATTSSDNLLD